MDGEVCQETFEYTITVDRNWRRPAPVLRSVPSGNGFTTAPMPIITPFDFKARPPAPTTSQKSPSSSSLHSKITKITSDELQNTRMGILLNPRDTEGIQVVEMFEADPRLLPPTLVYNRPVRFSRVGEDTVVSKTIFKDVKSASQKLKDMRLPFVCSMCSRAFSRKAKATRHESTCRGETASLSTRRSSASSAPIPTSSTRLRSGKRMSLDARSSYSSTMARRKGSHGGEVDESGRGKSPVGIELAASWPGVGGHMNNARNSPWASKRDGNSDHDTEMTFKDEEDGEDMS
ncbi:hypothetical protein HDU93_005462, partial [Gonapodya sp. JEL0774]